MKTIALLAIAAALTSCAGLNLAATTPYGDVTTNADGSVTVTPKPFVIPQK